MICACTFKGAKFADNLAVFKSFEPATSNDVILDSLTDCQNNVHKWGVQIRVTFDAEKGNFCILHKVDIFGQTFKVFGILIDPQLTMAEEIKRICGKA